MATFKDHVEHAERELTRQRLTFLDRLRTTAAASPVAIGAAGYFVARTNDSYDIRWIAWTLAVVMVFGLLVVFAFAMLRNLGWRTEVGNSEIVAALVLSAVMAIAASAVAISSAPVIATGFLAIVAALYVLGIRSYQKVTKILRSKAETPPQAG